MAERKANPRNSDSYAELHLVGVIEKPGSLIHVSGVPFTRVIVKVDDAQFYLITRGDIAAKAATFAVGDTVEVNGWIETKTWKTARQNDRMVAEVEVESMVLKCHRNRTAI